MKNSISFASEPFSKKGTVETDFKEGGTIYGRLSLNGPIKDYCITPDDFDRGRFITAGPYNQYIVFNVRPVEEDKSRRVNYDIKLYIHDNDLEKTSIDFDVAPSEANVSSLFSSGAGFLEEMTKTSSTEVFFGKKGEFIVEVLSKNYRDLFYDKNTPLPTGHITIDFASSDYRSQMDWKESVESIFKLVREKYIK